MNTEIVHLIGNILIYWSAFVATASVVVYTRVDWRHTPMGWHLMSYMAVMAIVLDLSAVRLTFGDSPVFQLVRLVTFVGVPVVMTWRLGLLMQAQRRTRARSNPEKE